MNNSITSIVPAGWSLVHWGNRGGWQLAAVGQNGSVLNERGEPWGPVYHLRTTSAAFMEKELAEAHFAVPGDRLFSGSPGIVVNAVAGSQTVPAAVREFAAKLLDVIEAEMGTAAL